MLNWYGVGENPFRTLEVQLSTLVMLLAFTKYRVLGKQVLLKSCYSCFMNKAESYSI